MAVGGGGWQGSWRWWVAGVVGVVGDGGKWPWAAVSGGERF